MRVRAGVGAYACTSTCVRTDRARRSPVQGGVRCPSVLRPRWRAQPSSSCPQIRLRSLSIFFFMLCVICYTFGELGMGNQ